MLQYVNHKMCYLILLCLTFLGVNRETGLVYPSGSPEYACVFIVGFVWSNLQFLIMFYELLFVFSSLFFWNSNVCSSMSYAVFYISVFRRGLLQNKNRRQIKLQICRQKLCLYYKQECISKNSFIYLVNHLHRHVHIKDK